jgi:hypothetical protein
LNEEEELTENKNNLEEETHYEMITKILKRRLKLKKIKD